MLQQRTATALCGGLLFQARALGRDNSMTVAGVRVLINRRARKAQIDEFVTTLDTGVMTDFDEEVFRAVIDSIAVDRAGGLAFRFIDGAIVKIDPDPRVYGSNAMPAMDR